MGAVGLVVQGALVCLMACLGLLCCYCYCRSDRPDEHASQHAGASIELADVGSLSKASELQKSISERDYFEDMDTDVKKSSASNIDLESSELKKSSASNIDLVARTLGSASQQP